VVKVTNGIADTDYSDIRKTMTAPCLKSLSSVQCEITITYSHNTMDEN